MLQSTRWNKAFDDVWIGRKTMRWVCSSGFTDFLTNFKTISVYDICKAVAPYWIVPVKLSAVHIPQLLTSYPWILLAYAFHIFKNKWLLCCLLKYFRLVMLIISLLTHAKQCAKFLNLISLGVLCAQVAYCLAPAFFLIWMPNLASATLMSSL